MKKIGLGKVIVATYAVVLVPTGLLAAWSDYTDLRDAGYTQWSNVKFWLGFGLEGSFLVFPVVLLFSLLVQFVWNWIAKAPSP
jgi:hypothetical protein